MVRFVFILLLVTAAALVIAIYFDRRRTRTARLDPLRSAFLHGRPLAPQTRAVATTAVAHPGGVRFHVPASWTVELRGHGAAATAGPAGSDRRIEVEMASLSGGAASAESMAQALQAGLSGERTVEALPGGHALVKTVTLDGGEPIVCYQWRLGRAAPGGAVQMAAFRLRVPLERAGEIITQSDLATLDREVREATFAEAAPDETAAG